MDKPTSIGELIKKAMGQQKDFFKALKDQGYTTCRMCKARAVPSDRKICGECEHQLRMAKKWKRIPPELAKFMGYLKD